MRKQNWLNFLKNYDFNIRVEGFSHIEGAWKNSAWELWMECSRDWEDTALPATISITRETPRAKRNPTILVQKLNPSECEPKNKMNRVKIHVAMGCKSYVATTSLKLSQRPNNRKSYMADSTSESASTNSVTTLFLPRRREEMLSIALFSWLIFEFSVWRVFCYRNSNSYH